MTSQDKYAVFGNPIKHSKSPAIHAAFASQCGQSMQYRAVRVETGDFERAASNFFAGGGKGLNITMPFKEDAFRFAGRLSERAQRAGAVNTLTLRTTALSKVTPLMVSGWSGTWWPISAGWCRGERC